MRMHAPQEQLTSSGFWEARTGWSRLKQVLFLEPLPGGARWSAAFGSLLLFVFALQIVTGILLTMNYAPTVDTAWPSAKYIQEEVPLGAFIRGLHHWGSSAMVILLLFHLVQVFVWGAYKKPREFTWMVGVLLLACVLGLSFTGYLLPWDQKAYWATKVGLGIASTTPVVGDWLRTLLQGGPEMGNLTLTRFFTLHTFLLPGLVILLIVVHLYLFRLHGVTPNWWQSAKQLKAREEPFWPRQVYMDVILAVLFLVALGLLVSGVEGWFEGHPAPLEAQADPSQPYEARPEWYFMFLFQLLRYFEGPYEVIGTFVLPTLFFLVLFFWPFLDRNPHRSPRRRPLAMTLLGAGTAGLLGLTIYAVATDVRMREPVQAAASTPAAPPAGPIQRADVARLYNTDCVACHGVDGTGTLIRAGMPTIPDFTSMAWQLSQTDLDIVHRIKDGNEPLMPAYRDKYAPQQMIALAVYVRAFAVAPSPVTPGSPAAPPTKASTPVAQMSALQVYRTYCMACHDVDGRGKIAPKAMKDIPDFTNVKWQKSHKDAEFKAAILDGKGPFMTAMKDKLGPADADRIVAYVRAFSGGKQIVKVEPKRPLVPPSAAQPTVVPWPKAPPAKASPAAQSAEMAERMRAATNLYGQYCLICHGPDGRGLEAKAGMPTIPDFTNRPWQEGTSTPQLVASILDGKGTLMPAFQGRITDAQAQDLAAFVRAFGPVELAQPQPPPSDFERRFQEVQAHWYEMQRQLKELSKGQ
jgi:quinol-cytochrome oxidoreductase complex cytochrome b subunit/cytochrome c